MYFAFPLLLALSSFPGASRTTYSQRTPPKDEGMSKLTAKVDIAVVLGCRTLEEVGIQSTEWFDVLGRDVELHANQAHRNLAIPLPGKNLSTDPRVPAIASHNQTAVR